MKYPLSKSEWKWWFLGLIMVVALCVVFGVGMFLITGEETFLIGSVILAMLFIWFKLIIPLLDRI